MLTAGTADGKQEITDDRGQQQEEGNEGEKVSEREYRIWGRQQRQEGQRGPWHLVQQPRWERPQGRRWSQPQQQGEAMMVQHGGGGGRKREMKQQLDGQVGATTAAMGMGVSAVALRPV